MSSEAAVLAISLARGQLIGTFLGLILYGVTCMQALFYFRTYEHDRWGLKATVAFLVMLETTHAVMTMWTMDDYLIQQYGKVSVLESATTSSTSTYILGLLIDFYVYLYFTWRIWLFTQSLSVLILMIAISTSRTVISIFLAVLSVLGPPWKQYLDRSQGLLIIGNTLFIIGDALSASAMAYHLTKLKSLAHTIPPHRPRRINLLLNHLLAFAVATGTLTLLVDVIALVLTSTMPQNLAFLGAVIVQTKLYANSLLASLNIRNAASRAYDDFPTMQTELPAASLHFARPSNFSMNSEGEGTPGRAQDVAKS